VRGESRLFPERCSLQFSGKEKREGKTRGGAEMLLPNTDLRLPKREWTREGERKRGRGIAFKVGMDDGLEPVCR